LYRKWLFGLAWFVIFIGPFLLVPPNVNDQLFEHRLYLPMIGLMIVLGHAFLFNGGVAFQRLAVGAATVMITMTGRRGVHTLALSILLDFLKTTTTFIRASGRQNRWSTFCRIGIGKATKGKPFP
jgi:hypothetical protein